MEYNLKGKTIGIGITGSYCTFDSVFNTINKLKDTQGNLLTVFSYNAATTDSRFGNSKDFLEKAYEITGTTPITTITEAEPIGPQKLLDLFIILPCTGNTLAKLAAGITDTPVLMAAKAHLRNNRPLVIFLSTNDALGANLKNIGTLLNTKNIYFVPFGQDNYLSKPNSMISDFNLVEATIINALDNKQLQPLLI